jgi:ATP-dependent Zn protease
MTWTQPPRIGEIAFHEAGHAAAAYALRRQIEKASINPHDRNAPSISLTTLGSRHLKRRGRNAVIALAGAAAERKHRGGKYDRLGADDDFRNARELLEELAIVRGEDPDVVVKPRVGAAIDMANRIVDEQWRSIESVADELLRRQELSGRTVRRLLRAHWIQCEWALVGTSELLDLAPPPT